MATRSTPKAGTKAYAKQYRAGKIPGTKPYKQKRRK